ncbi:early endosome antigen 1 [Drosophila sechellia]|uniref:GM22398 n=1 Tax=Drosophila sechellia TaxID=7238 RepID=B4IAU3_DROSE|nr:early endosome antigen 1 [Drosophila sechellia]XP_032574639.1 early endosome antigen 1 [Drosophila sechellia]EDW44406.1 GM22398 [Drosophila sechellia]
MDLDCESATAFADDSGHFSCTSDDGGGDPAQKPEPEPDQSMFLVRQELLRTRSEVERLLKSEQWYKQELKSQKHSRLETLERLYAQERKYLVENQRLQQESIRLHTKCATLEKQQEQGSPLSPGSSPVKADSESHDSSFDAKQQEARLRDQRQLIDVLRKQKKMLLDDIKRLSLEHEEKLSQLQQTVVGMELESKHVTGKCKQLLDLKSQMEHQLELRSTALRRVTAERNQLRQVIAELNETLQTQEHLIALKEQEFLDLKQYYQQKLTRESSMEIMHSYSMKFHEEINSKTSEIASLKNSLNELQTELMLMSHMKEQREEQQRQLEQLEFTLQAQFLEEAQLRQSNALKLEQVENLTISLSSLQLDKEGLKENLSEAQKTLKNLEQKVDILQKQYAEMCSLCQKTKQQLELEQIEIAKMKQNGSLKESELMEKLKDYATQCGELRKALAEAESRIDVQSKETESWQAQLKKLERSSTHPERKHTQATQTDLEDPILVQRIESLEQQLADVKSQKLHTVSLLQKLLQQQEAKIKSTNEMEADWQQLLDALQATQSLEQQMRSELQHKTVELEHLNELFAGQNDELQKLQKLSQAKDEENRLELQVLKETFQENLEIHSAASINMQRLQSQVKSLLDEKEEIAREERKAVECLRSLGHVLEMETGRRLPHIKSWPQLAKILRKELRNGRVNNRRAEELPGVKMKLAEISGRHQQALSKIKCLEQTLVMERARFEASDSGKSTASNTPQEPAHEVANLIDDYKKLVQQTANETCRPRNSFIFDLIERSQRCQPNLCQLGEGISACQSDMEELSRLISADRPQRKVEPMPSLMEELRAVAEHS